MKKEKLTHHVHPTQLRQASKETNSQNQAVEETHHKVQGSSSACLPILPPSTWGPGVTLTSDPNHRQRRWW